MSSISDGGVFGFLARKARAGVRTALVSITEVAGGFMRSPGAHLAVARDGDWQGSLSGGCVEAAIVAEALAAIDAGAPRTVRFGAGSPFIDIQLPCGGGLELLINPLEDARVAELADAWLVARRPFVLTLPLCDGAVSIEEGEPAWRTQRLDRLFRVAHQPPLSIIIAGQGGAVEALHAQATAAGAQVRLLTRDPRIAGHVEAAGGEVQRLGAAGEPAGLRADPWTAIALLFHDHDWELPLLADALSGPAFYVGAMGSYATHERRTEALLEGGLSRAQIARLHAPIGLIPASRDPQVLALSALAEIVRDFEAQTAKPDISEGSRESAHAAMPRARLASRPGASSREPTTP